MKDLIIITNEYSRPDDHQAISLEQIIARRLARRRRVAKRMAKRYPMMAVQFMQDEFPGYTYEEFEADISRKTRKGKRYRRPKSPLIRQGRYPLYADAMANYRRTKEQKYLIEAQHWRNRLFLPFELVFSLKGERRHYSYSSTTSIKVINQLAQIKGYTTWDELNEKIKELTKYSHLH